MNARLLIINPQSVSESPLQPSYLIEKEGVIVVCSDHYTLRLQPGTLHEITIDDLQSSLRLNPNDQAYLSEVRCLPDKSSFSEDFLNWLQDWWVEAASELGYRRLVAKAS